jgi:hypothetical protein
VGVRSSLWVNGLEGKQKSEKQRVLKRARNCGKLCERRQSSGVCKEVVQETACTLTLALALPSSA